MWNDTDIPLAYLLTFRSYGNWLHGDERGSIDRFHNKYGSPRISANDRWRRYNEAQLKQEPVRLDARRRHCVKEAIRDTCKKRKWLLYAVNIRTNHVHSVASIGAKKPEVALSAFKANATRDMCERGLWKNDRSPWTDKGSKRHLWNEQSIAKAIDYVMNGQGSDLPDFE